MQNNQLCLKHKQPIVLYDETNSDAISNRFCLFCISQKMGNLNIKDDLDIQNVVDSLKVDCQDFLAFLKLLQQQFLQYQQFMEVIQNKITLTISQQVDVAQNEKTQQLNNIVQPSNSDIQQQQTDQIKDQKQFNYRQLEQFTKSKVELCYAFAFNQDSSQIFFGYDTNVMVYDFKNGEISNKIQQLKGHTKKVYCINYMKKSNELITANCDRSIIIWNKNNEDQWVIKQKLLGHKDYINCVVINQDENLIISGSRDKTIRFWNKVDDMWISYQTMDVYYQQICGLSFDDQSNKLIACGLSQKLIYIIEQSLNKEWIIVQNLQTDEYGFRLCFIDSYLFAFQPNNKEYLEFYYYDQDQKEYKQQYQVQVKSSDGQDILFPCQYIQSKGILTVKNNNYLNILKRQDNGQFITEQSIKFMDCDQHGRMTDDGEYLVTWDNGSQEIQIRQLQYQN